MKLGAFSLSLTVKDLEASRLFYAELGFEPMGGNAEENWLMLRNVDGHIIGLFQSMFERNVLTFNPGWDQMGNETETYTDVREIQEHLRRKGVEIVGEADVNTQGPGSCMVFDPDGNPILIDQHR